MFGIAWGIASLVLMSALCDGFRQGQRKNMSQLGDNIVMVWNGRTEKQAGGQRAGRRDPWDSATWRPSASSAPRSAWWKAR